MAFMNLNELVGALSGLAFYELDRAGNVGGWTDSATRLLGFSSQEMIGLPGLKLIAADGNVGLASHVLAARDGRSDAFGWALRKDGSRFWANQVIMPTRDDQKQISGFATVVRDMTSWKTAEEERDRVFTLSLDLIGVAGFDGYFKRVNPSFTRVLGHSEAELLSKPFFDFIHPDDIASTQGELSDISGGQREAPRGFQNRYRTADGAYRWLEWQSQAYEADQVIYCVARDITDQKNAEIRLQDYANELERSNGELQQFAYVASHDLQEPLRAVAGCVQMLTELNAGKLDDRSVELMGHAVEGAKRMQTLINDLLAYSRVGSRGISKISTDSRAAVDRALLQLHTSVTESGAIITVDALDHVWADPVQLVQLFQNLIGNALKFRTQNKPEIHISSQQANGHTVFSVRDNGIGIAPEYQDRIFGIFQRLNSRREYSGTGIGLAICKKIVERHGGRIWVESQPDQGATFRFTLPQGKS
jgi:PAS domain S-box-containing protein